jgi:hypothetical protein
MLSRVAKKLEPQLLCLLYFRLRCSVTAAIADGKAGAYVSPLNPKNITEASWQMLL